MKRSQGKPTGRGFEGPRSGFSGFGGFGAAASGTSLSYLAEPPSFAAVSDPNVVVSLKNILKKDSTTKAKALEELLAYVQAHPFDKDGGVEEGILDVWVQIYPRTSIDNSRRVRELTHNLQFELMKSARKRFERHLPKIVGAWLAGLYDRDRVVARAASDGLTSFLNTPEKVLAFWTKCQGQILDYAIDAIQETQDTLSDERSTTAEDAEAKYYRVVTASLSLVLGLLQKVEPSNLEKLQSRYDDYFAEENVWKTITFNDSSVRRTVCQLLFASIDRKLPYADDAKVKQAFITGGLKTNQAGSALEYVRALTKMTQTYPDVWTSTKIPSGPKSPLGRLQAFVAKGSQGSPPKFWEYLDQLLMVLPSDLITPEVASQFLISLKSGITHRDEPRTNTSYAWKCFIDTAKRLLKNLPADDQLPFVQEHLFPLIEQFLFSVSEKTVAIPLGPNAISVLVEAYIATVQASPSVVSASKEEWDRLASVFCAKISGSLPEVSREYQQSQEKISEEGRRWFGLVGQIEEKIADLEEEVPDHTAQPSLKAISQSITLLESRNLKPFGAARIIEYALSMAPRLFDGEGAVTLSTFFTTLARDDAAKAVTSPSSRYLLSSLHLFGSVSTQFAPIWNSWVEAVLDLPSEATRDVALASLISNDRGAVLAKGNMDLQKHIVGQAVLLAVGGSNDWELLEAAVTYQTLTDSNYRELVQALVEILEKEPSKTESTLQALEIAAKGRPELFSRDERVHTTLVALLLGLSELEDSAISSKATAIRTLLDTHTDGKLPVIAVVQANLERAGTQSLDINTLVSQAYNAVSSDIPSEELFPSTNVWMKELAPLLELSVNPALSITNSIGGAVALVKGAPRSTNLRIYRDRKGRAIPTRMALYVSQLSEKLPLSQLPKPFQLELLYLQCLTVQLISDQITCMEENRLWQTLKHAEGSAQAEEFVSKTRGILNQLAADAGAWSDSEGKPIIQDLIDLLTQHSQELTPRGLYSARALSELVQFLAEAHGASSSFEDALLKPDVLKIGPTTVLPASAIIAGFGETLQPSKIASNFCNKVVSEVAGAKADSDKTLMTLVLLSQCAQIYEAGEMPVANNRIVFAVRQITSWLDEPESLSPALCAEICRALNKLLPCMKDVYGSYWEKTIEFCISLWNRAHEFELNEALPFIHSSLRLFKTIESLQEPNDDLEDALKEYASAKPRALIELLRLPRDTRSQPLEIVDAMLCREVQKISLRHVPDLSDIFGLVASESRDIQTAAFNLLHQALPEQQQQKSIDALLEKTGMRNDILHEDQELTVADARLPDELLSLLLDAPTLEKYSDEMLAEFPSPIRSYLLSWKLVFDAYSTSSFKIRNDFTDNLKQDNCVGPLLDFMFDVLGHSAAHPLKLEKVNLTSEHIQDYDVKLAESEPEEKNMQWLLVHLFYLLHKYTPGLFRAWYIDCRSKQTRIAVESWTTKYFSPIIVSDVLDEVQKWADSQEPPAMDEKELVVRVARSSREIIAGYEVDEDQAAIAIKIPQNYPIENVSVQSLNRVAVNEKKWQSWIMTTQGVITFSNGNIIDGLQVFKRNILGALKGQTECAICYSIISTDKRMPDKRCTTCKNLFHRTCLYKWFQSSNQNTCPLCRNPIDYLGSDTKRRQG
ncbi:e3 ubiquitin ligase listerin [Fusarium sp. NRRL 25303]|nr:e3 ubiquitin ligase listerin [Fusarium sp. NRRL 25303]